MPLRLRSAGGGSVQLNSPVALATDVSMEVPGYAGAKLLTNKTPGAVLQVVQTYFTDRFALASGTPTDITGFAATITPSSTTSKILVMVDAMIGGTNDTYPYLLLKRNGTVVGSGAGASGNQINTFGGAYFTALGAPVSYTMKQSSAKFLDSPNTTGAVTYQLQLASPYGPNGLTVFINRQLAQDNTVYTQFPTSNITLMEIAA